MAEGGRGDVVSWVQAADTVGIHLLATAFAPGQKHEVVQRMAADGREVTVVLHMDAGTVPAPVVCGRIETPEGEASFHGWLDLLGQLEAVVDRAREREDGG